MEMSYVFAVVITGLVVVFLGLVLLIAFITAIGAIFKKLEQNKKPAVKADIPATKPLPRAQNIAAVSKPAPVSASVPASANEDDDEIIAVISAAVAMMSASEGKNYRIRSVRAASSRGSAGNAWASAALREATRPF